jgi:hypothetical protein
MDDYEKAFQSVTSVVLGRKLTGYRDYEGWLTSRISGLAKARSALSGKQVYFPVFGFYEAIRDRLLTKDEAYGTAGKMHLSEEQVRALSLTNAAEALKGISITTADTVMGTNSLVSECAIYYDSSICFGSALVGMSKYAIYSFWPRQSEYVVGCHYAFSCSFCVRCFNSENLSRCFEVSDSTSCSDCYFCYNCENLQDCMFCFNTKAKKHAIGNVQFPPEQYRRIKEALLGQIAGELERDKELKWDIYSIGAQQPRKRLRWRDRA